MAEEKEKRDWSVIFAIVVVGVPVIVFFVLDFTVLPYWKSGHIENAQLVADGERLFVLESVGDGEDTTLERMRLYDVSSPAKKPLVTWTRDDVRFEGYAGERLWFSSYTKSLGWHARDPRTLEVTITQPELAKKDSRLARIHEGEMVRDGVRLTTIDGYELFVDAATLAVTDAPTQRRSWSRPGLELNGFTLPDGRGVGFDGDTRSFLTLDRVKQGQTTWISPHFLVDRTSSDEGQPFVLGGGQDVLLMHRATVDGSSPLSISRVSLSGAVSWTRPLGKESRLVEVARSGEFLYVIAEHSVRSIWLKDGSVAVQHDL